MTDQQCDCGVNGTVHCYLHALGTSVGRGNVVAFRAKQRALKKAKRTAKAKRLKLKRPTHAKQVKEADRLFSLDVRSVGHCESGRHKHAGVLQCAHGFSRRYEGSRWLRPNAFCLCAGCHVYFTHRPIEWDDWLRTRLGVHYDVIRWSALRGGKQDMDAVLAGLSVSQRS